MTRMRGRAILSAFLILSFAVESLPILHAVKRNVVLEYLSTMLLREDDYNESWKSFRFAFGSHIGEPSAFHVTCDP
jgi:hypothetical protein